MKKFLSLAVAVIMILSLATTPVLAGPHHNKTNNTTTKYSVCTVADCIQTGVHSHSGKYYTSHYYGDGHKYHEYCGIEECTLTSYHEHDDEYYFGHCINDGHDYHDYCAIKNCTLTGYHEHSGEYCFGHSANDGHGYHQSGKGCH